MWQTKILTSSDLDRASINAVLEGVIPAIIIKEFCSKLECSKLLHEIKNQDISESKVDKLNHIGPFLMAHTTNKEQYFKEAKEAKQVFEDIFCQTESPIKRIHEQFQHAFPKFNIGIANENQKEYSRCIIRMHEKGKKFQYTRITLATKARITMYQTLTNNYPVYCISKNQKKEAN